MGISSSSLDFEDTIINSQEGNIECSSSEIEDKDVSFSSSFFVKTISDGCSGGFVDDSEDIETSDGSSILGGLSLVVIEVGGDSDDCVFDGFSEERLGGFSHFG